MNASSAPPTVVIHGRAAAPGFAAGPIVRLDAVEARVRPVGTPEVERLALAGALAAATDALATLIGRLDDTQAEAILEFQLALIDDPELTDPVVEAIDAGAPADRAWAERLDAEITGYAEADDDYFRARAGDLEDLKARVLALLTGDGPAIADLPDGAIVLARDLAPSRFLELHWRPGHGIALVDGSPTAHVAILARGRGVPMIVGLGDVPAAAGAPALLDGPAATLTIAPDAAELAAFQGRRIGDAEAGRRADADVREPAATADGEAVSVNINIGGPDDLDGLDPAICDGIGLVRTEFLFHGRSVDALPGEDEQHAAYARILAWAAGRRVTIRTCDAGGDKPIPGYTLDGEANPFLGLRGVRLSLSRPEIFRLQLRALLRAAVAGSLDIMVPMVSVPREMEAVRALLADEAATLDAAGVPRGHPRLGMMVEVPAAALSLDLFDVDFVSIGSNDLTQYVMAAGRDAASVAELADPTGPAVIRLIGEVVDRGRARGIPVSLCGDAGGDPAAIPALLAAGLRSFSMSPTVVARAKAAIRCWARADRP